MKWLPNLKDIAAFLFMVILILSLVVFFTGCKSTKQITTDHTVADSAGFKKTDSTSLKKTKDETSFTNEVIKEWLQPINNYETHPIVYREIYRNSGKTSSEKTDSNATAKVDSSGYNREQLITQKKTTTTVFSMWWLVAIAAAGIFIGWGSTKFKISKK